MRHFRRILFALGALLLIPRAAEAHLVTTGLGPVYDGIGHLVLTMEDLIPVFGIALLAGLRGKQSGRWVMFTLPAVWLLGGLVGLQVRQVPVFPLECISFLLLGALVASDIRLGGEIVAAIAVAMGLMHGYLNGAAISAVGTFNGTLELLGITITLFVLLAIVAALVVSLRQDWARIVVRVAGSWIVAIGLLLLGWSLRPIA